VSAVTMIWVLKRGEDVVFPLLCAGVVLIGPKYIIRLGHDTATWHPIGRPLGNELRVDHSSVCVSTFRIAGTQE
jgi:hypothetical protein